MGYALTKTDNNNKRPNELPQITEKAKYKLEAENTRFNKRLT